MVYLNICMSLDGYISDENNNTDWIDSVISKSAPLANDLLNFINRMNVIIIGKNTYNQIIDELGEKEWPYKKQITYVLTDDKIKDNQRKIYSYSGEINNLLKKFRNEKIWLCGGASVINQMIKDNLIDYYTITIISCFMGNGIRLFQEDIKLNLKLTKVKHYKEIVTITYKKINK